MQMPEYNLIIPEELGKYVSEIGKIYQATPIEMFRKIIATGIVVYKMDSDGEWLYRLEDGEYRRIEFDYPRPDIDDFLRDLE
ncbi:MAG: hypothetical protein QMD97_01095 [Candidatus Aenigmarchaeota archaeon]|nr:hypothetical protein [Candidatus Aenigmarchaeota archaeon]